MKKTAAVFAAIIIIVIAAVIIPVNAVPPNDTRIILDHDRKTYIAPPCFQNANASNFLEETQLEKALELDGYKPEGTCTSQQLKTEKTSLFQWVLLKTGLTKGKWDW
ncbi:hypothetical protein [Bacillus marinisedimentorum]|uniref:hypothetical protein n=1 Tax=Bacillus marinisedimentorum TaxID=1821260 RepID=UPI0007E264C6|nr:hypothetical protein [Bacillus marinisedimentorum]